MLRLICLLLVVWSMGATVSHAADYGVANGFIYLHGHDGWFDALKLDPSGIGDYSKNLIRSLSMGLRPDSMPGLKVTRKKDTLTLSGFTVRTPYDIRKNEANYPFELRPGHTLGVKLTSSGKMTSAGGKFPTWHSEKSGCTLSVYRLPDGDLSKKQLVASKKLANVPDNSVQTIEFDPQPAGDYYVEISEPTGGQIGWWGAQRDVDPSSVACIDSKEESSSDLAVVYGGYNELAGEWSITVDGRSLRTAFRPSDDKAPISDCAVRIVTPWEKKGYDLSKFPFSRFYTDTGRHMLVQQLKRRPFSDQLQAGKWVYAMGKEEFDVRFDLATGQHLGWEFEDTAMTWKFNGSSLSFEVLPHNPKLPGYYPVFYSSDKKYADILNEFYYSHAFNFGVGTPADWKEWQALILDWTANPQVKEQRGHFTGMKMRPDGGVYTWGDQEGWPFPYKDEDKDGKNDLDTRHFTSNSTFILGAYRYFCWTRDIAFLKEIMPKLRKAMDFELNDLQGKDGVIMINAKGHEGREGGIGSNYWDILPFGYKDAFCNSYYYEALRAMGDLERFCAANGIAQDEPKQSPSFYESVRAKVRSSYNEAFWDDERGRYVGCVDVDGVKHDYGFTFVNVEAMTYGLAEKAQVERVYHWMETEPTSSGAADTYSKWLFAPRANTIHNPPRSEPQTPAPSWWHSGWGGTPYGDQCQDGGAILYTSFYDVVARARYLGADNAYRRLREILDRYNMPDRLCGGSPLFRGEETQGGPGGHGGSVGVEGEFPESGLAPASFLYAFLGIDADTRGLKIRPNVPSSLKYAGVRNLCFNGITYDIRVTNDSIEIKALNAANFPPIKQMLKPGETFVLAAGTVK